MFKSALSLRRSLPVFSRGLATPASLSHPSTAPRKTWTKAEVQAVHDSPLLDLVFRAASVHRMHHDPSKIQLCTLMNIKSEQFRVDYLSILTIHLLAGGCSEDCKMSSL